MCVGIYENCICTSLIKTVYFPYVRHSPNASVQYGIYDDLLPKNGLVENTRIYKKKSITQIPTANKKQQRIRCIRR